jgi:hypothetical protein
VLAPRSRGGPRPCSMEATGLPGVENGNILSRGMIAMSEYSKIQRAIYQILSYLIFARLYYHLAIGVIGWCMV